jgi:hypothetical protein
MEIQGILGVIILILDIYAILKIVQSSSEVLTKAIWIAVVVLLPVIGLIAWFFFGPGRQ